MSIAILVSQIVQFYVWLIIGYIILSWIPAGGALDDVRRVLSTLVDPYLNIFRRIIPPIGAIDISPIVAILVLNIVSRMLVQALFGAGL
jgi:YggT family protein